MGLAWVICEEICQIKKYNVGESNVFSWLLNKAAPKAVLFWGFLLFPVSNDLLQMGHRDTPDNL